MCAETTCKETLYKSRPHNMKNKENESTIKSNHIRATYSLT